MPSGYLSEYMFEGEESGRVKILLAGDPHLWENPMDAMKDTQRINRYGAGCDSLVLPGDVAHEDENVQRIVDSGEIYEDIRIAYGNNDEFDPEELYNDQDTEIDTTLVWEEEYEEDTYTFSMKHDPARYGIKEGSRKSSNLNNRSKDIVIAAHNHIPESKVLNDGILYINPGSIYQNYDMGRNIPKSSIFMLEIDEKITVTHLDYERDEVVTRKEYVRENGVFRSADRRATG